MTATGLSPAGRQAESCPYKMLHLYISVLNVAVESLEYVLCIRQVPHSTVAPETAYGKYFVIFPGSQVKYFIILKQARPIPSKSFRIHY